MATRKKTTEFAFGKNEVLGADLFWEYVTASYRIPDELSDTMLGEVKNVGDLSYTSQLRDLNMYSQQNGLIFQLTVRPTTTLSPALQAEVANGNIVLKFLPKQ